jgi:hypothetical protein
MLMSRCRCTLDGRFRARAQLAFLTLPCQVAMARLWNCAMSGGWAAALWRGWREYVCCSQCESALESSTRYGSVTHPM